MVQILEQLFNSKIRAKVLRLFLRNPSQSFQISQAAKKIKADYGPVRRELENLAQIKVLIIRTRKKKGERPKKYFQINKNFAFYNELRSLVLKSLPTSKEQVLQKVKKLGRIKLALISGVFLSQENCRADFLVVGENISQRKLKNFLDNLGAEVGKEIDYAVMETDDFKYRREMFDKFILDLLDGPCEVLIDKIGVGK